MKKGWKIFWWTGGSLVIAGILCCIVAFAMGASVWDLQESYYGPSRSYEFSDIEELKISCSGELNIYTHEEDTIIVEAEGGSRRWRVECEQEGSELDIEGKLRYQWFGNVSLGAIDVYVPENYEFREVKIEVGAGLANVSQLQARELKVEVGAGEANVDNFIVDQLKMTCGAGKLEAQGQLGEDAKIENGVGTVNLLLAGQELDYNYDVDCGVGEVLIGSNSHGGLGHSRQIDNRANKDIDVDCGLGEVSITFDHH
ncbi:DUF4097 domain-containing protein [Lachnospiraceae bacterium OttesenSCG-928-E19]|nr:DUF4097 domain-containing protein [Lachnospiraceae bacterium OttesenSCG-928-E19]